MITVNVQDTDPKNILKHLSVAIVNPPKTKDAVKERANTYAIGMVVARALLFITAKVALALQAVPPFGMIVAPVMELGRCVEFVVTSVRDLHRLHRSREFITESGLTQDVKDLCLRKLEQDKYSTKIFLAVNVGYLVLAAARVALITAAMASLISTGVGLPAVTALGIGLILVANVARFALDAYARPNTTRENFNGNGLKYFWLNTVVLSFQGYRLRKELEGLAKKYSHTSFGINDEDVKRYLDKKKAFETTVAKVAVLDRIFRKAGMLDVERNMRGQSETMECLTSTDLSAEKTVSVPGGDTPKPVASKPDLQSFVENFSVETYNGYNRKAQEAFRLVFGVKPEKLKIEGTAYLQKRLEVLFSEFSLQGYLDRLELAEGRSLAQIAPYVNKNLPP